jgi:hypothetical protein
LEKKKGIVCWKTKWMAITNREKRENGVLKMFEEIMAENFPSSEKYLNLQIQKVSKSQAG